MAFATFLVWRLRTGACGVGACGFGAIECPPPIVQSIKLKLCDKVIFPNYRVRGALVRNRRGVRPSKQMTRVFLRSQEPGSLCIPMSCRVLKLACQHTPTKTQKKKAFAEELCSAVSVAHTLVLTKENARPR